MVVQLPTISDEEQQDLRHAARVDRIAALEPLGQLFERLRRPDDRASTERRVGVSGCCAWRASVIRLLIVPARSGPNCGADQRVGAQ